MKYDKQIAKFIEVGTEYKQMLETIKHEDGDLAWIKLNKLREDFFYESMELHASLISE